MVILTRAFLVLAITISFAATGSAQSGPIAHFPFDTNGAPGDDVAGAHDATQVTGVTQVSGGVIGNAGLFTNGWMQLPASADLNLLAGDFTLSVFVKGTPPSTPNRNWFTKASPCCHRYGFGSNNVATFFFNGGPNGGTTSTTNVFNGAWHHLAGIKRGNTAELWIDGVKEATATINPNFPDDGAFAIGRDGQCCEFFNGQMDEAKIWNRALTQTEIDKEAGGIPPTTKPDLTITELTTTPTNPTTADTITINGKIKNIGNATSPAFNWVLRIDGNQVNTGRPGFLAPGATYSSINWTGTLPAGTHDIELIADTNSEVPEENENNNRATLSLGVGVPTPVITVSPTSITFQPTPIGQPRSTALTITNDGAASLQVQSLTVGSPFSVLPSGPFSVAPGASSIVTVTFLPYSKGPFSDTIMIVSNAPTSPTAVSVQGTVVLPDLTIESVTPNQAVEIPASTKGVILVAGKPLVVRTKLSVTRPELVSDSQLIRTRLQMASDVYFLDRTFAAIKNNEMFVDFYVLPTIEGPAVLNATVDPSNVVLEEVETNNYSDPVSVQVVSTKPLDVWYLKVECEGPLTYYFQTASQGGQYLRALFPVASEDFTHTAADISMVCTGSLENDYGALWLTGKIVSFGFGDKFIGIVDDKYGDKYFPFGPFTNGIALCGKSVGFVRENLWETIAHEVGHMFDLNHPDEVKCAGIPGPKTAKSGFWVERARPIIVASSLMSAGGSPVFPSPERWITASDYSALLTARLTSPAQTSAVVSDQASANAVGSPPILLISGTIGRDGTVEFAPFYQLPSGLIDDASPGDYVLEVIDKAYSPTSTLSFSQPFDILSHPPTPISRSPFGFAVPFPSTAQGIRLLHRGVVLAHVNPLANLLTDAIRLLPDESFQKNAAQTRKTLLNKAEAFTKQLEQQNWHGAFNHLENDIRKFIDASLSDSYTPQTVLTYSKTSLLALVDNLLQRLENTMNQ